MAEKRRGKKKKEDLEPEKPTKEEYAVSKFLRFNVPVREGKLVGMTVQCFIATKAVDALLESKWSKGKNILFTNRNNCIDYCNRLLEKGIFHRAGRIEKKKEKKIKKKDEIDEKEETVSKKDRKKKEKEKREKEKKDDKENKDPEDNAEKDKESEIEKEKETEKKEEKKEEEKKKKEKKEKKLKLEMHNEQLFKDGDEVYVWIYDPVPVQTFLIGLLLVLGAIAVCLFPLWPPEVRLGVYYLSLAVASFVGFILALCVLRLILFCMIWVMTFGKHHFWFLPNLTEDVGFLDSFRPLYHHEYGDRAIAQMDKEKEESDKATEESKKNEETSQKESQSQNASTPKSEDSNAEKSQNEEDSKEDKKQTKEESETGSENDNGYEIVNPEEMEDGEEGEEDEEERSESEEESTEPKKTR